MLEWLFGKKEKPPEVPKAMPFFSTAVESIGNRQSTAERAFALSIQKHPKDIRPINAQGVMVEGTGMDDGIQDVKFLNSTNFALAVPDAQLLWYAGQGFIGYQTCALISQNWLIEKSCVMPGRDAVRHGYEVTVNDGTEIDPAILDYIRRRDKEMRIKKQCVEFVKMGRVFGIRVAMFDVTSTDKDYYEKPFNPDGVTPGSYKGIAQIDPYWITPELDQRSAVNPASRHFYEPTWWRINGKRVHRTHLVIMRNGDVPDILKPTYLYGGIPVPQKLAERVYAAERTANEAPLLAMTKRLTVLNADMAQAVANMPAFEQKMLLWTQLMNNYGVKVIGGDEEIEQFDTSLADVDDVIMSQFQLVAAAAEVPVTKLLGTTPKGFNATGEYDDRSYHESLESIQEHDLSPLVERHHMLLMRSEVVVKFKLSKPINTELKWHATDSPTAKEIAERNKTIAETDNILSGAGAIDGADIRQRLIADVDSGYNGIDPVVPGGPGDREAEQERRDAELEQAGGGAGAGTE